MSDHFSTIDLFSVGIGPSSSHTVGPMRAAGRFMKRLEKLERADGARLRCELYGSLAATGKGHGTDRAIVLGLLGHDPETIEPDHIAALIEQQAACRNIPLGDQGCVSFDARHDLVYHRTRNLPLHPNGIHFQCLGEDDRVLCEDIIYSVGGGSVYTETELRDSSPASPPVLPFPYHNAAELLRHTDSGAGSIAEIALANERVERSEAGISEHIDRVWRIMRECVERGLAQEGTLPGGLRVPRRAKNMAARLKDAVGGNLDPMLAMDWINVWALAVNEENAAGGRVVTAPTNGAAGIIPAVMHYTWHFITPKPDDWVRRFLLTAGAIGWLYKNNASISGADVGCQGEVGVASSMAAAGLAAVMGGCPHQVENAAEIGMEHNLGLTCDPIGGLVQIPCIERNAMGSVKAVNAARLALAGDGTHQVSLDKVMRTMRETGRDMSEKYKETARGGLAVNFVDC